MFAQLMKIRKVQLEAKMTDDKSIEDGVASQDWLSIAEDLSTDLSALRQTIIDKDAQIKSFKIKCFRSIHVVLKAIDELPLERKIFSVCLPTKRNWLTSSDRQQRLWNLD